MALFEGGVTGTTQNKVWSIDPQGLRWEWYRVIEDSETFGAQPTPAAEASSRA